MVQPLWRTVWRFLKKLKIEPPYDLAIPLPGIYPEKTKTVTRNDTCAPVFTATLLTTTKMWKQLKCPLTDKWVKKMWCIYTMEYYAAIKKNKTLPLAATWIDLKVIMLSERKTNI